MFKVCHLSPSEDEDNDLKEGSNNNEEEKEQVEEEPVQLYVMRTGRTVKSAERL
jgi:hypothetical protein